MVDPSEAWLQDECRAQHISHRKGGNLIFPLLALHPMQHSSLKVVILLLQCYPHEQAICHYHDLWLPPVLMIRLHFRYPFLTSIFTAHKCGASFSLNVTKKGRGKPDFQLTSQVYIELTGSFVNDGEQNTLNTLLCSPCEQAYAIQQPSQCNKQVQQKDFSNTKCQPKVRTINEEPTTQTVCTEEL